MIAAELPAQQVDVVKSQEKAALIERYTQPAGQVASGERTLEDVAAELGRDPASAAGALPTTTNLSRVWQRS
ncbi:MAG: hypothetical protein DLM55_04925 [Acidimicrobiales bacterium]|nr:MAG: hypothetical protein DLM55_04925 [Acidimicrobiales bacterium]